MSISKIVDKKYNNSSSKVEAIECMKNVSDCMYMSKNGMCSAEWCVFDGLPSMISTKKEIECVMCGKKKTVSIYNAETSYICPDCDKIIDDLIRNPKCAICGNSVSPGQLVCKSCQSKLKEKLNE